MAQWLILLQEQEVVDVHTVAWLRVSRTPQIKMDEAVQIQDGKQPPKRWNFVKSQSNINCSKLGINDDKSPNKSHDKSQYIVLGDVYLHLY